MSVSVDSYIGCNALQQILSDDKFVVFDPTNFRNMESTLGFLVSQLNNRGVIQRQIDTGSGHSRSVELLYIPRFLTSEVGSDTTQTCGTGTGLTELSTTYEIERNVGSSITRTIDLADLEDSCSNDEYYLAKVVSNMMDSAVRKMNAESLAQINALLGNWALNTIDGSGANVGGSATPGSIVTKRSGTFVPDGTADIKRMYRKFRIPSSATPILISSDEVADYTDALGSGCCTDVSGIDANDFWMKNSFGVIYDNDATGVFGNTTDAIGIVPGAVQLLTYNRFRGANGVRVLDDATYKQGTLVDPFSGIEFDYLAQFDCGKWNLTLSLAHKVVGMPTDMYYSGDDNRGVTFVNKVRAIEV